jgi:hypothetical protein
MYSREGKASQMGWTEEREVEGSWSPGRLEMNGEQAPSLLGLDCPRTAEAREQREEGSSLLRMQANAV